jgi:hypothetical protein
MRDADGNGARRPQVHLSLFPDLLRSQSGVVAGMIWPTPGSIPHGLIGVNLAVSWESLGADRHQDVRSDPTCPGFNPSFALRLIAVGLKIAPNRAIGLRFP